MEKEGTATILRRIARTILMADLALAVLVGVACFFLDLDTFEAYGTLLVWVGAAVTFLASLTGIGGFASRNQDMVAFSISRAGDMSENLLRIAETRQSSLGCFLQFVLVGIGLIAFGYLVQIVPFFF